MPYKGPERRIHKVFSTRNREYHVRSSVCVAVRDRQTKVWISSHQAIGMKLQVDEPGIVSMGRPLMFCSPYSKIRTSRVMDILRPGPQTVDMYNLVRAICPT